jgi:hypothetical protein
MLFITTIEKPTFACRDSGIRFGNMRLVGNEDNCKFMTEEEVIKTTATELGFYKYFAAKVIKELNDVPGITPATAIYNVKFRNFVEGKLNVRIN